MNGILLKGEKWKYMSQGNLSWTEIKKHMDNDGINAYPEEHDMDW